MKLEKSAFEFAKAVDGAENMPQLEKLFLQYLEPFGIDFYLCGQLIFPGGIVKTERFFVSSNNPWFQYYVKNYLWLEDPISRIAKDIAKAFTWSWVLENIKLSKAETKVFTLARRFGLQEGVMVPVHGPYGALAGVSISGPGLVAGPSEVAYFESIMRQTYFRAVDILGLSKGMSSSPLSNRQRECLNWAQHGKSNRAIASILGISEHTVKEHIDGAKKILGVTSRIEAVIRARSANLINNSPLSSKGMRIYANK